MAMSHRDCDHPSTPADRAKCRRRQETVAGDATNGPQPVRIKKAPGEFGPWGPEGRPEVHANAPKGRKRFIRTEGDMAALAVPHAFSAVIRHAWSQGYEVRAAEPYNPTEKRIEVRNSHGDATLVWRPSMAHGVWGCFWRPIRSSVTSKVTTVNQLISRIDGKDL